MRKTFWVNKTSEFGKKLYTQIMIPKYFFLLLFFLLRVKLLKLFLNKINLLVVDKLLNDLIRFIRFIKTSFNIILNINKYENSVLYIIFIQWSMIVFYETCMFNQDWNEYKHITNIIIFFMEFSVLGWTPVVIVCWFTLSLY